MADEPSINSLLQELKPQAWGYSVHFDTDIFDVEAEPENEINPIPGHAALSWLRGQLLGLGYQVSEVGTEDWGWYVLARRDGLRWLVGCSGVQEEGRLYDWRYLVKLERPLLQVLLRRGRMERNDPLLRQVLEIALGQAAFGEVFSDTEG